MKEIKKERVEFIAERFNIFEDVEVKVKELTDLGFTNELITDDEGIILAIKSVLVNDINKKRKIILSFSFDLFSYMISVDPTIKKIYLQWMLITSTRLLKSDNLDIFNRGLRLLIEDLPLAGDYLAVFEENKKKKIFNEINTINERLKHISDLSDINKYFDLSELYDAIDPFIVKDVSVLEKDMQRYVKLNQARILCKDRHYTVYIPLTLSSSIIFSNYASWCTTRKGNTNFKNYRTNYKKPNNKESDIYIIINNKLFTDESEEIYQIHFETNQIKDRLNSNNVKINHVLEKSEVIKKHIKDEIINLFKMNTTNKFYVKYLFEFGFSGSLIDLLDESTPTIKFMDTFVEKLDSLSKFKNLSNLILINTKTKSLNEDIGELPELEMISVAENELTRLPESLCDLKKLIFLNIKKNNIDNLPKNIYKLDKSNGGSLISLSLDRELVNNEGLTKIKGLLPNVILNYDK